jgi:serine/threonine protein kinase
MYRLSVVGMPSDGSITKAWLRTPDGERYYRLELGIMCDLQNTGLVPDLIDFGEEPTTMWVRVVALDPLAEWLEQNGSAEARAEMRDRIRVQLRALHRAGVCHRDVHLHNVVVDEAGVPRFIDFELAARVDPRRRLLRPGGSGQRRAGARGARRWRAQDWCVVEPVAARAGIVGDGAHVRSALDRT